MNFLIAPIWSVVGTYLTDSEAVMYNTLDMFGGRLFVCPPHLVWAAAASRNEIELLKWLKNSPERIHAYPMGIKSTFQAAAMNGDLELLEPVMSTVEALKSSHGRKLRQANLMMCAVKGDNFANVKYLAQLPNRQYQAKDYDINQVLTHAIANKNIPMMDCILRGTRKVHTRDIPRDWATAAQDDVSLMHHLATRGHRLSFDPISLRDAARLGYENMTKFAVDRGACELHVGDDQVAATSGNKALLEWFQAKGCQSWNGAAYGSLYKTYSDGKPYGEKLVIQERQQVELMQLAQDSGLTGGVPADAHSFVKLLEQICDLGHLKTLEWIYSSSRCKWTTPRPDLKDEDQINIITSTAALNGHVHILEWVYKCTGRILNLEFCAASPQADHRYRVEEKYGLSKHFCVLEWGHAHEYKWSEQLALNAVQNFHLEILQWMHRKGFLPSAFVLLTQMALQIHSFWKFEVGVVTTLINWIQSVYCWTEDNHLHDPELRPCLGLEIAIRCSIGAYRAC